jgi:hypothetical protein
MALTFVRCGCPVLASKTRLVLVGSDGQEGLSFPLSEGEHVAGRLEGSIMFPEDRLLSPRHATFLFQAGKLWVRDDGSFNGVFVKLRAPKIVPSGTLLLIGEQLLRIDAAQPDILPYPDQEGTYFYCSPHRPARLTMVQFLVGGDVGLLVSLAGRHGDDWPRDERRELPRRSVYLGPARADCRARGWSLSGHRPRQQERHVRESAAHGAADQRGSDLPGPAALARRDWLSRAAPTVENTSW